MPSDREGGTRETSVCLQRPLLKFQKLLLKLGGVYSMHHQKLAIQVEDGDVKFISFIPSSIFWKCDVHLL